MVFSYFSNFNIDLELKNHLSFADFIHIIHIRVYALSLSDLLNLKFLQELKKV